MRVGQVNRTLFQLNRDSVLLKVFSVFLCNS